MNDATQLDAANSLALDATQAAPSKEAASFTPPPSVARTTVLPRVDAVGARVSLVVEPRSRYELAKVLAVGGMGEVALASDHDIGRKVAVKRLLPELTDEAVVARFVDEIRTVGRLEHPNIVPIHDVGVDERGRYFFVMKFVDGETLESVIEKLAAGDPAYVEKYSIEARIELFLGLLHALEYTHAQGVVHRDIKPANVMIGHFGEVVLMDWGVAKPVLDARDPAALAEGALTGRDDTPRSRMYATRIGALIGTPAYMSPEQAIGDHSKVDTRSDLYSAMVLFHELLGLEHYLASKTTLDTLLEAIKTEEQGVVKLIGMPRRPPAELIHLMAKGLAKDPSRRFQSAGEVISALQAILEGRMAIQCKITLSKRTFRELGRLVDRAPLVGLAVLCLIVAAVVFSAVELVRFALHAV